MKINKDIKNILKRKLLISFGILSFVRIGTFLPVPGINHTDLAFYLQRHLVTKTFLNTFSGDNTFIIGLFTLNIFPSINASILVQLIIGFLPQFSKLQKEGTLEGRRKITRLTRLLTLVFAIIQSFSIAIYLRQILFDWNYFLAIEIALWLTTGAMIVLWLSELITDYGLGNGSSLLVYTNIISNVPNLYNNISISMNENSSIFSILIFCILILISLYGIVFLQESFRIIPLISAKQLNQTSVNISQTNNINNTNNYIPLRFNQAGVMPIILTTTILLLPSYVINYLSQANLLPKINLITNFESLKFIYWIGYFSLISIFSLFYSRIILNPKDLSDQLQKMAVTIPKIRPGTQTTFYLKQTMKRMTLIGATMLGILVTMPNFFESTLNFTNFNGLSVTSLLIVAGVILDLIREVRNIYYSNIYNNKYQ